MRLAAQPIRLLKWCQNSCKTIKAVRSSNISRRGETVAGRVWAESARSLPPELIKGSLANAQFADYCQAGNALTNWNRGWQWWKFQGRDRERFRGKTKQFCCCMLGWFCFHQPIYQQHIHCHTIMFITVAALVEIPLHSHNASNIEKNILVFQLPGYYLHC